MVLNPSSVAFTLTGLEEAMITFFMGVLVGDKAIGKLRLCLIHFPFSFLNSQLSLLISFSILYFPFSILYSLLFYRL